MSECCACKRKLSFFDPETPVVISASSYVLCENCNRIRNQMKDADSYDKYMELETNFSSLINNPSTPNSVKNYFLAMSNPLKEEMERKQREQAEKEAKETLERERQEFAKSFNEFYEYDVVTIINRNHGTVDKKHMIEVLSARAAQGWRLHSVYSNELGKNALSILGLGINATACEDVLIFERRVASN